MSDRTIKEEDKPEDLIAYGIAGLIVLVFVFMIGSCHAKEYAQEKAKLTPSYWVAQDGPHIKQITKKEFDEWLAQRGVSRK